MKTRVKGVIGWLALAAVAVLVLPPTLRAPLASVLSWVAYIAFWIGAALLALRFSSRPLSRFVARLRLSIRWKLLAVIVLMALPFLVVSLINFAAMEYMHDAIHRIQALRGSDPRLAQEALNALGQAPHSLLFSSSLYVGSVVALIVLGLGIATGLSLTEPVRQVARAMRRVAAGDFSQRVQVANRDELGDLVSGINNAIGDLARLQEATVAAERARALRERIVQVTMAQEEERRRISRELHDGLGPSLAALANRLRASQRLIQIDPERVERELEDASLSLRDHVQEIRELAYNLRPVALDQLGLVGALQQQVERLTQESHVQASLQTRGNVTLAPLVEVTAFRVAQECLNNIRKHAAATEVEVHLTCTPNLGLQLTVADNGRGFDIGAMSSPSSKVGLGLLNMRERAELLGGQLSIETSSGKGCRITLSIPPGEVPVGAS